MRHLLYIVINEGRGERVTSVDCDSIEQAYIIDRTLLPVLETGSGWADSRKSDYRVAGSIKSSHARFALSQRGMPVATLYVCLSSKSVSSVWRNVIDQSRGLVRADAPAPVPAWAVLRHDNPAEVPVPIWLDWWSKHLGYALLNRAGW